MEGDVRIVQITIRDRQLRKLTAINNEIPEMLSFQNDTFHLYRENSTSTFDFTIPKWYNGKLHDDVRLINDDVYISFIDDDRHYYFYVHTLVQDDFNFILTCNDANLEYTMEQANPFVNSESHNIEWYLKSMDLLELANVHIGLNEISDVTRTLSFDNQETKLERLSSLISQFGGEFDLVTEVDKNGKYSRTRLDIYHEADDTHHGVGKVRGDVTLTYGKDVKGVQVTSEKEGFFNAGVFTGADGLNITDLDKSEKDADGNEEYYTRSGSPMIYAPKSRDKYPSSFLGSDKWTRRDFSTDYKDKNELYAYALRTIKQCSMPQITYLVNAQSDMLSNVKKLSKGDTVYIYDKNFEGGLLIKARVSEVIKSFTNPMNDTYVFSNYVLINREVSATLQARIDEILASKIPHRIVMVTSNGTSFKNGTGQSIVSPKLFKGDVEITDATYRFNFNNNTVAGLNYTVNASAVNGTSVLKIDAYVGNDVVARDELTFINVNDGSKGADGNGIASTAITYQAGTSATVAPTGAWSSSPVSVPAGQYLWTRTIFTYTDTTTKTIYSVSRQGVDGANGKDGIAGKDGVGISSTVITYGLSANETTQPTTWTANPPTLVKGQYLWTKTVWTYTDAKTETGYTKTYIAKDGNNGTDGIAGKDGVGILSTTITYQASTSGTTVPTGTWSSQVPSVPNGQFLWTRTVWNYTDNTSETGYSVAKMGTDGKDGKDGSSSYTHVAYADKSTDILVDAMPTLGSPWFYSGATGTVSPISGGYKYTTAGGTHQMKQVITFNGTTGKNVYTYLVIKNTHTTNDLAIAFNGIGTILNGGFATVIVKPGQTYVDYRPAICRDTHDFVQINILATVIANDLSYEIYDYAIYNTNPIINFSVGGNANNAYIGMYVDNIATDSTDPTKYRWTLAKGQDGAQGIQGPAGADGKTPYWHTAYANSSDGKTDFSITDSTNKRFIGQYTDYTQADSTDPTKYKWVDMTANVKVGNNNLLVNTKTLADNYFVTNNTSETYLGGTVATGIAPSGSYRDTYRQAMKIAPEGNEFIVSFYAKSSIDNVTINNHFYSPNRTIKGISSTGALFNSVNGGDGLIAFKLTTQWKRYWIKWTIRDASSEAENVPMNVILGRNYDSVNSVSIALPALYAGNLNTEHSDAPEDTQLKIDSKADQALTQAQMLALEERSALARDNAIAEAMKNTISEVEAKWQTWYNLNTADEKQKVANDIASLFERVAEFEQNLGEASAKFSFINNETLIGEEGVAIGDKEGKAKLFLSNDSISFVTNGVAQMTLTGDTLTIKNGLFTERIQIGNYVEEVYDRNPLYNVIRPIKYS